MASVIRNIICLISFMTVLLIPATSLAAVGTNPYAGVNCKGRASASTVCSRTSGDPVTTTLHNITNIIAVIAGAAAVIIIIYSGIRLITGGSSAEEVSRSKRAIIFAAVGLVIIIAGRFIINMVLSSI